MRISSTNYTAVSAPKLNNNFKGLYGKYEHITVPYSYQGEITSYNNTGVHSGYDDTDIYTYHPFLDESPEEVKEVLRKGTSYTTYDPEMTGGFEGSSSKTTQEGVRLTFTKNEWQLYQENKVSEKMKFFIEQTLERLDLNGYIKR